MRLLKAETVELMIRNQLPESLIPIDKTPRERYEVDSDLDFRSAFKKPTRCPHLRSASVAGSVARAPMDENEVLPKKLRSGCDSNATL